MVALVRAGVTATCSSADRSRYGNLDVDSNLPDARIALGGPDENAFTAKVLAEADPVYAEELKRQLYASGSARVWVPAAAPLASSWLPDADLRGIRVLPVLIVAGSDGLDAAVAAIVDDLGDAEISVSQQVPSDIEPYEDRTVAVLNRGVPSFAVDIDGTLHTSLMRSCTGWPSGVWMDPQPRRTAPDGSNFQLQHWTHTFDYALVTGDGDWRSAAVPHRSAEFSHPLLAVVAEAAPGRIARQGSLLRSSHRCRSPHRAEGHRRPAGLWPRRAVDPGRAVNRGSTNPRGWQRPVLRSRRLSPAPLRPARRASPDGRLGRLAVHATRSRPCAPGSIPQHCTPTRSAGPGWSRPSRSTPGTGCTTGGPRRLADCPPSRTCIPQATAAAPGDDVVLRLTAASDCTDAVLHGTVRILCPPGWTAEPAEPAVRAAPAGASGSGHRADDAAGRRPARGSTRSARNCTSPATTRRPCPHRGVRSSRTSPRCRWAHRARTTTSPIW